MPALFTQGGIEQSESNIGYHFTYVYYLFE